MYHPSLLPFLFRLSGTSNLAGGAATGALVAPTTRERIVLGWVLGSQTVTVTSIVELQTSVGFVPVFRAIPWVPHVSIQLPALLTVPDNGLRIQNIAGAAAQDFAWTIVWVDLPRGFLQAQPIILGPG